jgi:hypothetical protein
MIKIQEKVAAVCVLAFHVPAANAAHAASPGFSDMCRAAGGEIHEQSRPPSLYIESSTEKNREARLYFPSGAVFRIDASLNEKSPSQSTEIRKILQFSFFAGLPVNLCVDNRTSPNTILIVEVSN